MTRWLSIGLFIVAIVAFFFVGRSETSNRQKTVESVEASLEDQIQRETSGAATPANRIGFLRSQKKIIGSIKNNTSAASNSESSSPPATAPQSNAYMPIIVTAVLGVFAIGLIVAGTQQDDARKWAFATLGTIVGYWLKG